jgi:UPF0716 protein FxsA
MSCLARLAFLFVVVPVVELVILFRLGQAVGVLPAVGLVLTTGFAGAVLARAEGLRVFLRFQGELAAGRMPGQALLDGISVLVGGALLMTPGILTDAAGLALLFPPTRRWIQRGVRGRLEAGARAGSVRFVVLDPSAAARPSGGRGSGGWDVRHPQEPELDPRHEIPIQPRDS